MAKGKFVPCIVVLKLPHSTIFHAKSLNFPFSVMVFISVITADIAFAHSAVVICNDFVLTT